LTYLIPTALADVKGHAENGLETGGSGPLIPTTNTLGEPESPDSGLISGDIGLFA